MEPKCSQCQGSEFDGRMIVSAAAVIVFCTGCGHIAGVCASGNEFAKTFLQAMTRGSRDQLGHPVFRIKAEEKVFG